MKIFGIVNVTPDSFSDGGRFESATAAVDHALCLEDEGAAVLDIGGESTRPGAEPVAPDEERRRVLPVIEALRGRTGAEISVDTRKPSVAADAIEAGATIWNDVTALTHAEDSVETAARLSCKVVLMHMQGDPRTMQASPAYSDVTAEVIAFLHGRIAACEKAGIPKSRLVADPGIGFGKALDHNLALFGALERFETLGVERLLGASRKRFISTLDRDGAADTRVGGSIAAALRGQEAGFEWVRVHDVAATRQALAVHRALRPRS